MATDQLNIRLDPRIRAAVEQAIRERGYPSISAYVVAALLLQLELDGMPVDGYEAPNPILVYFESERGQDVLRRLLREVLDERETGGA
jgi:Arc/MetJ-type ribon-helix-helix transcriptional regulator